MLDSRLLIGLGFCHIYSFTDINIWIVYKFKGLFINKFTDKSMKFAILAFILKIAALYFIDSLHKLR